MIVLSDSDDDFETQPTQPCSKKHKIAQSDVEKKLDAVMNELLEVKATMTEMMTLQKTTRIPLSLLKIMRDTFQCSICHIVPVKTTCNHHEMLHVRRSLVVLLVSMLGTVVKKH